MPTFAWTARFRRDFESLTPERQVLFLIAVKKLTEDLKSDTMRRGLRVKAYQGVPGWFEMTWAPDGRALLSYGEPVIPGERHVIWQRIGGHEIFGNR